MICDHPLLRRVVKVDRRWETEACGDCDGVIARRDILDMLGQPALDLATEAYWGEATKTHAEWVGVTRYKDHVMAIGRNGQIAQRLIYAFPRPTHLPPHDETPAERDARYAEGRRRQDEARAADEQRQASRARERALAEELEATLEALTEPVVLDLSGEGPVIGLMRDGGRVELPGRLRGAMANQRKMTAEAYAAAFGLSRLDATLEMDRRGPFVSFDPAVWLSEPGGPALGVTPEDLVNLIPADGEWRDRTAIAPLIGKSDKPTRDFLAAWVEAGRLEFKEERKPTGGSPLKLYRRPIP